MRAVLCIDYTPYFQTTNMTTEDTKVHEIDCSKSGKNPTCMAINVSAFNLNTVEIGCLSIGLFCR